ncbi:MAG TPA: transposase, partial [Desulfatiglandales bacterium]
ALILIYLMRIVAGLAFFWHVAPVILRSQPLMRIVGFNGTQTRDGTSRRGKTRSVPSDTTGTEADTPEIRGPICPDSIATYIQAVSSHALERLFNRVVSILAAHSFFPKHIHALLDSSEIQSTELCEGCGKVTKEKAPALRHRRGRIRKVLETVFGFKVWVLWDPTSRLPLAIRFATIEHSDIEFAREVVQQAVNNLAPHATIASLAIDRAFIDGPFLWWLEHTMGIIFYIPAKTNMNVYDDALSLVDRGIVQTRERKRSQGAGKNKTTVTDRWHVVGIPGLTSAGFYGEKGSGSHENRSDFIPNPLHAVVVLDDPYKHNNPHTDTLVILTNAPVDKPLEAYDGYDARSEIENTVFREAKQAWFIQRAPRNNAPAFRAHVYLTVITMALTTAFQTWMDQQDKLDQKGKEVGIRKFRQIVKQENGNKLILFDEDRYAIFDTYEVFILCGRTVLMPTGVPETISKTDILLKYGALLE